MLYTLSMESTIAGVTVSQAARFLGIARQTVLTWEDKGIIHATRTTAGWRYFDESELRRILKERQSKTGAHN